MSWGKTIWGFMSCPGGKCSVEGGWSKELAREPIIRPADAVPIIPAKKASRRIVPGPDGFISLADHQAMQAQQEAARRERELGGNSPLAQLRREALASLKADEWECPATDACCLVSKIPGRSEMRLYGNSSGVRLYWEGVDLGVACFAEFRRLRCKSEQSQRESSVSEALKKWRGEE